MEKKTIQIDRRSDWKDITHSYIVEMLHDYNRRYGRMYPGICVTIIDGNTEEKIVNLNRISYIYTAIKIHYAAKRILKILSGAT